MEDEFIDPTISEHFLGQDSPGRFIYSGLKYQLIEKIGEGGMGEIWKAERMTEIGHKDYVAIKFIKDDLEQNPLLSRHTLAKSKEALLVSQLQDENIVRFLDAGYAADGSIFIVMDYLDGTNLREFMGLHGLAPHNLVGQGRPAVKIPDKIAGFIMLMAARALVYTQKKEFIDGTVGILHRDISPDNYIISKETGAVKQIDFGIALKFSEMNKPDPSNSHPELVGKLEYMSPEALLCQQLDYGSDLFSLGLVAYELITGFNPQYVLNRGSAHKVYSELLKKINKPILPVSAVVPGVEEPLEKIIGKLTQVDPGQRYANASDLARDLFQYLYPGQKTIGVTKESLRTYLKLISDPLASLSQHEENCFDFLRNDSGKLELLQPYQLCPEARAKLALKINPAR